MAYGPATPGGRRQQNRGNAIFWSILGGVALILLIWFIWDVFVDVDKPETGMVTIDDVVDNPQAYVGRVVTLRGTVESMLGPESFVLESENLLLDEQILVMGSVGELMPIEKNDTVVATGTVRVFALKMLASARGRDLQYDLYHHWEGKPVLMASRVVHLIAGAE